MREKIYEKIFENLEDLLAEEQAKLGYRKEPVRFYYPLSSLNHFFDASFSEEEMKEALKEFPAFAEERFGNVEITGKGERFCFFLSEKATEYVHGHQGANAFIFELVETLSVHGTTMAEVEEVFKKQPFSYERKKVEHPNNLVRIVSITSSWLLNTIGSFSRTSPIIARLTGLLTCVSF